VRFIYRLDYEVLEKLRLAISAGPFRSWSGVYALGFVQTLEATGPGQKRCNLNPSRSRMNEVELAINGLYCDPFSNIISNEVLALELKNDLPLLIFSPLKH
jgi:hypothetical protein